MIANPGNCERISGDREIKIHLAIEITIFGNGKGFLRNLELIYLDTNRKDRIGGIGSSQQFVYSLVISQITVPQNTCQELTGVRADRVEH